MELKSKKYTDSIGNVEWQLPNGNYHRLDGPARKWADGDKEWWVNGNRHRLDGPAIEYADGDKEWWVDGKRHRFGGPAVEWTDGSEMWFVNGERHRLDGPAVKNSGGYKEWWVDGEECHTFQSYLEKVKPLISEQEYFILVLTYGTEK